MAHASGERAGRGVMCRLTGQRGGVRSWPVPPPVEPPSAEPCLGDVNTVLGGCQAHEALGRTPQQPTNERNNEGAKHPALPRCARRHSCRGGIQHRKRWPQLSTSLGNGHNASDNLRRTDGPGVCVSTRLTVLCDSWSASRTRTCATAVATSQGVGRRIHAALALVLQCQC